MNTWAAPRKLMQCSQRGKHDELRQRIAHVFVEPQQLIRLVHAAASNDWPDIVQTLLSKAAENHKLQYAARAIALRFAALRGSMRVLAMLVPSSPHEVWTFRIYEFVPQFKGFVKPKADRWFGSLMQFAVDVGQADVVQYLVKQKADVHGDGGTPCGPQGLISLPKRIYANCSRLIRARNSESKGLALLIATDHGNARILRTLVQAKARTSLRHITADVNTPLCYAAASGNLSVAKLLVAAKSDVNERYDRSHATPLHFCCMGGPSVRGPSVRGPSVRGPSVRGPSEWRCDKHRGNVQPFCAPCDVLCAAQCAAQCDALAVRRQTSTLKFLVESKADVHAVFAPIHAPNLHAYNDWTPLALAQESGLEEAAEYLMRAMT
jgi:ankyrin repeat protein